MKHTLTHAAQLDEKDLFKPLAHLFEIPVGQHGEKTIYLNGNSLGPKPKCVEESLMTECDAWGTLGARGHFYKENPWVSFNERVTQSLARLVGAKENEVVATGTLTTNLHFTFVSFYRPTPKRFKIIRLAGFPSDTYAIHSQVQQRLETITEFTGAEPFTMDDAIVEIKPDDNGYISLEKIKKTIDEHGESTAVIWIEAMHYLTGQFFNIPEIVRLAHEKGCKIGLDLAHAIGNVPLSLHEWDVDFAVWCHYKYVSAGPGAIGGLYIHEKFATDPAMLRFAGWWGNNKSTRFQMLNTFDPIPTAEGWQTSNSVIFSLAALHHSLSIFDQIDLYALREKNKRLSAYLETLIRDECSDIQIITPIHPDERGCQMSLRIKDADPTLDIKNIFFKHNVLCDVRGDKIRIAPVGLYTTFVDVFNFVEKLKVVYGEVCGSQNRAGSVAG